MYPHPIYLSHCACALTANTCLANCACALIGEYVFGLIAHAHCAFFSWKNKMAVLSVQISVGLKVLKNWGLHPVNELATLAEVLGHYVHSFTHSQKLEKSMNLFFSLSLPVRSGAFLGTCLVMIFQLFRKHKFNAAIHILPAKLSTCESCFSSKLKSNADSCILQEAQISMTVTFLWCLCLSIFDILGTNVTN